MGNISFFQQEVKNIRINRKNTRNFIEGLIAEEGNQLGEISIIFCSDEYLLNMNKQYLNHNYLTDVITFDYCDSKIISGDIFISVERVKENAFHYSENFIIELYRVIFHGVLHLNGYGDKTDEEKAVMREKENYYLHVYNGL